MEEANTNTNTISEKKDGVSALFSSPSLSPIEEAKQILAKIDEKKKELDEQEARMAKQMLAGRADAGSIAEKKEETPAEYAKRITGAR